MSLASFVIKKFVDFRSWKTSSKFIVFESDDWGSERTKDKSCLKRLLEISPAVASDRFSCIDSIASSEDISFLFEVLTSVKDKNGNYPKITANVCTANPDFERISSHNFQQFFYEPFYKTISDRPDGNQILKLWREGIERQIFVPQLHGREHVHAMAWLAELNAGNRELLEAFRNHSWSIPYNAILEQRRKNLLAALDIYNLDGEETFQQNWIKEGADIFSKFFGFKSATFIPPAYTWHNRILSSCKEYEIEAIQGIPLQYEPVQSVKRKYRKKLHINGSIEKNGIIRLSRNAPFEPASKPSKNWVESCMKAIDSAFDNNFPAIIGSHRINYVGTLDVHNRDNNLRQLKELLDRIIEKWPNVEFLSSNELLEKMKV
jgi:hypothetical protein